MNKNLFNTNPMTTGQLTDEYTKYIEETATNLVRSYGDDTDMADLEAKAQKEAEWSSWVVSTSRRNFAYHQACFALNKDHTMGGVRPTAAVACIAVARHISQRAHELVNKVKPKFFRFMFVLQNRPVMVPDVDPASDDDGAQLQIGERSMALYTIRRFYKSYLDMGIGPPIIKMIGYDENHRIIEENVVDGGEQEQQPKVNIESEYKDHHPLNPPKMD